MISLLNIFIAIDNLVVYDYNMDEVYDAKLLVLYSSSDVLVSVEIWNYYTRQWLTLKEGIV